jgi:transglutaminase-like putative cysteine protease
MNRRDFLQAAGSVATGCAFWNPEHLLAGDARWRTFEVTTQVEVLKPSGTTRVWVPAALVTNTPYQKTLAGTFHCEGGAAKTVVNKTGALGIIVAEFPQGRKPILTVTSRVATRDWAVHLSTGGKALKATTAELKDYLRPTRLLPTDGIVKETADEITRTCTTDTAKARAIYEWIVENTYRNPKTRGCGVGDIRFLLESRDLGGKCADLNALYVGLARAAGVPCRDVYGIRVAKSNLGYKSLGAASEKISKAQHCRAEVYLSEYG